MNLSEWSEGFESNGQHVPTEYLNQESVIEMISIAMIEVRRNIPKARFLAKTALKISKKIRDPNALAQSLRVMGHVFLLTGNSKRAVAFYNQAWAEFSSDPLEQANTAVAMVQALAYVGEYEKSFEIGDKAIKIYRDFNEEVKASRVQANIANTLHRLDRLDEARQNYQEALSVITEAKLQADLAIVMRNYGVCLMGLQLYKDAEQMYNSARHVFELEHNNLLVLEIDLNQAYLLGRQGLVREALVAYRQLQNVLPEDSGFEIGHCLLDQADFMNEFGLYSDAERAAKQAVEVFTRLDAKFELGKAKLMQGIASLKLGKISESKKQIESCKRLLFSNPNQNWKSLFYSTHSELMLKLGRKKAALKSAISSLEFEFSPERSAFLVRRVIAQYLDCGQFPDAELLLQNTNHHDLMARLCRLRGAPSEAEILARRALDEFDDSRQQLSSFGLRRAQVSAKEEVLRECFRSLSSPEERLSVVMRIKAAALVEAIEISLGPSQPQKETDQEGSLRSFRDSEILNDSAPRSRVDIPTIPEDTLCIELFCDEDQVIGFMVSNQGIKEYHLGSLESFLQLSKRLRFNLSRDSDSGRILAEKSLAKLFDLFAPILEVLPNNLVIATDSNLSNIPFQAMMTNSMPLYQQANVAFAPSIGVWGSINERTVPEACNVLLSGSADHLAPKIAEELGQLAAFYQTEVHSTFEQVAERVDSADIIHFAAHGIVSEEQPMFSAMRLGNGNWTVLEFLRHRLQSTLTILSGCSTGISTVGDSMASEGFVEALLQAGSASVLAALWDASDEVTAEWMVRFHRELKTSSPAGAYRKATDLTRLSHPHPMYWANFVLFGKVL